MQSLLSFAGFCPIYDTFEHKVKDDRKIDCTKILHPCPSRFISTESYKCKFLNDASEVKVYVNQNACRKIQHVIK